MTGDRELPVPDAALADLTDLLRLTPETDDGARVLIRAISAPVVAAVLRAEADRLVAIRGAGYVDALIKRGAYNVERAELAAHLSARADEIDPS